MLAAYGKEIKSLQGPWVGSFFWIVALVVAQITIASVLSDLGFWTQAIFAWFLGAFLSHGLMVLSHESSHNLIFKSSSLNRLAGILCDFGILLPNAMAFRKFHLLHHLHLGDPCRDPDIVSMFEKKWVGNGALRKFLWIVFLGLSQALRPVKSPEVAFFDRYVVANIAVQCLVIVLIWHFVGTGALVYMTLSTFLALGPHVLGGRWIAEHYGLSKKRATYSYYGKLNGLMFNMGFHTEHHDFPNIPWIHLPKLREISPEQYRNLQSRNSYLGLIFTFVASSSWGLHSRSMKTVKDL